ncbi:MAG: 6-hydroxymethylpterin diphosphokinase MptE-like protein [Treponema sp.]
MSLEYSKAKNQSLTCSFNGVFLHSSYNPEAESRRFVENIKSDFIPENIILIEPALSYCNDFLKEKFPDAKLFAIRFIKNIEHSKTFEKEFFFENAGNLKNELFNYFGEDRLLNSLFISWPPSAKAFCQSDSQVWLLLKDLLNEARTILVTRQFFAKRWIKNQINFFSNIHKTAVIDKIDIPVLICASGRSLESSIKKIKAYQDFLFIIACSSSIKCLLKNGIKPDLCISTDGGFWAKKHLDCLLSENADIPLAVSSEANIPSKLFLKNTIVPLMYCDNFDDMTCRKFGIDFNIAKRNGTISGTALELAFLLTDRKIFFCGLDLETKAGFAHVQPNELELQNSAYDNKLKTKEMRVFIQSTQDSQLELYRNWFINNSHKFEGRFYRLSDNYEFKNSLGKIKDINWDNFESFAELKNTKKNSGRYFRYNEMQFPHKNRELVKDIFSSLFKNSDFIKNYFPADCIAVDRAADEAQKDFYRKKLQEKIAGLENSTILKQA